MSVRKQSLLRGALIGILFGLVATFYGAWVLLLSPVVALYLLWMDDLEQKKRQRSAEEPKP